MYKKIHRRLALVFTSIPSMILILMSAAFLAMSEKALYKTSFLSFSREMDTIVSHLEQQEMISYEWLAKISDNGKYVPAVYDQGVPLSYTRIALSEKEQLLLSEIKKYCSNETKIKLQPAPSSASFVSAHREFTYTSSQKELYYVCLASVRGDENVTAIVLYAPKPVTSQITAARIRCLLLNVSSIVLLFFFSWHYTKHLLSPIQKSQEGQAAFIAAASHELRTPLGVIQSCASAIKYAPPFEQGHFLDAIEKESRRMSRLVTDLLTLTRADSHTLPFQFQETELDTLLLDTCEQFRPLAAKKQISMHLELAQDLFPTCQCDGERIIQLLGILISNAISYQDPGGCIRLSLAYKNSTFLLHVADRGIGIPDDAKAHIFERFYRVDPSRCEQCHMGLGLCIADKIVKAHRGSIQVSDGIDGGTVFTVRLPSVHA